VLELELLLPLGEVAELPLDDGDVVVVSVDFEVELLDVLSDERGVVVVPGDADGLVRSGTVPTRSVSVRLHATVMPPASARAQRPDSNFFIADDPPLWGVSTPRRRLQRPCPWYDSSPRPSPRAKEIRGMKLEGSYVVPAPRQTVWDAFLDPAYLKQAIPGCEKLEAIGPDEYKATMKIGVGGVKGTFEGKVKLVEKKPPESYTMAVDGSGGPGFIRGGTLITLTDAEGGGTRVAYSADVQIGGLIASVGQRMLGGVAKMMADKFFGKMADLLKSA
jgi:carbon monoxide dehydrogenase subunit G